MNPMQIAISEVVEVVAEDAILAPNSHNHGHTTTVFAWSA